MPAKACQWFYNDFTLFSALPVLFNMYTDKDSNLISDLRTKYGEDSVRTFRKWEIIIKKMVDYRNHRRFMLKCIKASITPVSCKVKNPLSYKSSRSYQIIHKAEKQLLYECIRNINNILATLDKQREDQYKKFKDTISHQNNQDHDQDLDRSRLFINRIKEHRHDKIKTKHIEKFEKLPFKHYGCHYNINRHTHSFNNTNSDSNTLSGQPNVPSSFSTSSTPTSTTSSIPATPMAPTPSIHTAATYPAPGLPPSSTNHTCTSHMDKWVINLSKPPLPRNSYPSYKKVLTLPSPPNTPHRSLRNCNWMSILQATNPGSRWVQVWGQQNTQTTTATTQRPLQPQPFPMQSPHRTQKGQHQDGSYSRQGGGHGHHGPRGLYQQSPSITTGHQHIQIAHQGSHHPT